MIGVELIIIVFLLVILFIVLIGHIYTAILHNIQPIFMPQQPMIQPTPNPTLKPKPKASQLVGGCEGTRYGCCSYSEIPKLNEIGSNCRYQN